MEKGLGGNFRGGRGDLGAGGVCRGIRGIDRVYGGDQGGKWNPQGVGLGDQGTGRVCREVGGI